MSMQDLFDELLDLPVSERIARLNELALDDNDRNRLRALLDASDRPCLLSVPVSDLLRTLRDDSEFAARFIGREVGTFRVMEQIGQGGFAYVFRAIRPAGDGEQVVALKLLRTNLRSADAELRFRREQAMLAQLTHPHIAHLVEAGIDDASGHPYIALEYSAGEPITIAATTQRLAIEQRLKLFVSLCRAIDSAHAALIVHCDLKPSNILVDRHGFLKVLDFGIARWIGDGQSASSKDASMALTPGYAAPEQYCGSTPTVSVDVYSLGVILGELMTGQRLLNGEHASKIVLANAASALPTGLPAQRLLAHRLAGDLDAIIAKAMHEDPRARYRSPGILADDIERHLAHRPVLAHVPTRRYRTKKFIARNRTAVVASSILLAGLIASLGIAAWQAVTAARAAREARQQATRAGAMRDMVFDVLSETEPGAARDKEITLSQALESAIAELQNNASVDTRTRLEILSRFAETLGRQGRTDRALELTKKLLVEAESTLGREDVLTLAIANRRAGYEVERGNFSEAVGLVDDLLEQTRTTSDELRVRVLRNSASLGWRLRNRERALRDGRAAVALSRQLADPELLRTTLSSYGAALYGIDEIADAVEVYEQLLQLNVAKFGEQHEQVSLVYSALARVYRRQGDLDRAEAMSRKALAIDRVVFPGAHPTTANHLNALTMTLMQRRDLQGAYAASKEAVGILEKTVPAGHLDLVITTSQLGMVLFRMERFDEALPHLRRGLDGYVALYGESAFRTATARSNYGAALIAAGDESAGKAQLDRALADFDPANAAHADALGKALERRLRLALQMKDGDLALTLVERLGDVATKVPAPDDQWWTGRADTLRGFVLLERQRAAEARAALLRAGTALATRPSSDLVLPVEQLVLLSLAHAANGDEASAKAIATEARRRLDALPAPPANVVDLAKRLL
jgi:eukaryotic-like serine/threonine-protein kinase